MLTQCVTPKMHTPNTQVWLKICSMTVENEGGGEEEKIGGEGGEGGGEGEEGSLRNSTSMAL